MVDPIQTDHGAAVQVDSDSLAWARAVRRAELAKARYLSLSQVLEPERVKDFDIRELDAWLSSEADARDVDAALMTTLGDSDQAERHTHKVSTCAAIEEAASMLINLLLPLGLAPSLENEMFRDWVSLQSIGDREEDLSRALNEWEALKGRLTSELEKLMPVAAKTAGRLKADGGKRGKPSADWRNTAFAKLSRVVKPLLANPTKDRVANVARLAWNIYFPSCRIMEDEAAIQILRRHAKHQRAKT